jgi:aspartyl protease family protein
MGDSDTPHLIWAVCGLIIIASSLFAYQLPISKLLKMVVAWVGIFAFAFLIRPEMKVIWERVAGELTGSPRQISSGKEIRLTRLDDGHFWVRATINDQDVDFMVDSGATVTAINANTADKIGVDWVNSEQITPLSTANGKVIARRVNLSSITVDDFVIDDHAAVVAREFGDTNVVGMNFLNAFDSWNVAGDTMVLKR